MNNTRITLNQYQQLMLQISMDSPYNAVHAIPINPNQVDTTTLQNATHVVLQRLGLGVPQFSSDTKQVTFIPLSSPIELMTRRASLDHHAEQEINHFFSMNAFPLRFFLVFDTSAVYFSITYNHWIGDAYAISRLMDAIFTYTQGQEPPLLTLEAPPLEDCFQHIYRNKTIFYRYLGIIQTFFRFSPAYRTEISNIESIESGCFLHFFEQDVVIHLLTICRAQQITLNDLFIAILAQLFGRVTQNQREQLKQKFLKPKRDQIIIAVISNIRGFSQRSLSHAMGLFLGFFYLSFKSPESMPLQVLSQQVTLQTKRFKKNYAAVKQYLLFQVQKNIWNRTLTKKSKYRLFSKNIPITAGISNMDLNKIDPQLLHQTQQYIRFSPTAMVCPFVFNLTTLNGSLSLGVNYRKACYTAAEAENIKNEFVREIQELIHSSERSAVN